MKEFLDLDAEQAKCLLSPLRAQVMQTVLAERQVTAADLARLLDIHEKTIYYHVRKLETAGLIVPAGQRYGTTKPETLYEPAAKRLRWEPDKDDADQLDLAARRVHNILRRVEREAAVARASDRPALLQVAQVRLSQADAETLRAKIDELTIWANHRRDTEGESFSFGAFLTQIERKR